MGSIANDISRCIVGGTLENIALGIGYSVDSLYRMTQGNINIINAGLPTFSATVGIGDIMYTFRHSTDDFALEFDKSYSDGSNILGGIERLFYTDPCLRVSADLLGALGIDLWSAVDSLPHIPKSFVDWIGTSALDCTLQRIFDLFPYDEFSIGVNLGTIEFNINAINLPANLVKLNDLEDCLEGLGVDISSTVTHVNEVLGKSYITTSGNIDYASITSSVGAAATANIREVVQGTNIVLNNSLNAVAKVQGQFQIPRIKKAIS